MSAGSGAPPGGSARAGARALAGAVQPHLFRLGVAALLAAGAELAGLALLATATWLLVSAAGQPPLASLTVAIVSVRAFAIGRGTLRYAERLTGHDAVLRILATVRARLFAALIHTSEPFRAAAALRPDPVDPPGPDPVDPPGAGLAAPYRSGDLLSRVVSDVEAVQDLLLRVLVPAFAAGTLGVTAVVTTAVIAPPATPVLTAGLLVAGVVLPLAAVVSVRRAAARVAPLRARVASDAIDSIEGAADLAAAGATMTMRARARRHTAALASLEGRLATTSAALDGAGTLVAGLTAAGVVAMGVHNGVDGVPVAVTGVGALVAVEACLALLGAARQWALLREPLRRVTTLLAGFRDQPDPEPASRQQIPVVGGVDLVASGLRARYPDRAQLALAGVDLTVPPGARIAVVGPSGAGKSTLLSVLAGLHPLAGGAVSVAGRPVSGVPPAQRPRLVGGLFADAHVFHATVRANLLLGRPEASDEELQRAVRDAGLADWLREQPDRLNTVVGQRGGQLSGGQRQRLLLARALLSAPAVLLLDEPTEGLAPSDATDVLAGVLAGTRRSGRGVVLVTHQLLALDDVDEVLVLDLGQVVQRGTPRQLAASPGWYRDQLLAQRLAGASYRERVASDVTSGSN